jgi:hypothetical protein
MKAKLKNGKIFQGKLAQILINRGIAKKVREKKENSEKVEEVKKPKEVKTVKNKSKKGS